MPPPPLKEPITPPVTWYGGQFQYQPPSTCTSRRVGYKSKRQTRCDLCQDNHGLYEEYCRKIEESDGFGDIMDFQHCPNCWRGRFDVGIMPVLPCLKLDNELRIFSEVALMMYNEKEGSNLKFVKVVKANYKCVAGFVFYITFDAKDASSGDGRTSTFEAEVYSRGMAMEVELVRPKVNA